MMELADVIAEVESGRRPTEFRFEPELYEHWRAALPAAAPGDPKAVLVAKISGIHHCSAPTATVIACTSWGLFQLLGENLFAGPWQRTVVEFVNDAAAQRDAFDRFLARHGIAYTLTELIQDPQKRRHFIATYNGPLAVDAYWAQIKRAVVTLGGPQILE